MEAPTNGSFGQWSRKSAVFERNESKTNCKHRPATLFYPSDVYYNPQTKAALARIRSLKRDELPDDLSHLRDGHGGGSDDDDDNRQHQVSTKPAASDETMKILNSCGNKHSATMTLIGYKGGTLESQINQDRAIVASPFFISDDERRKYYANMEENEKDNSTRRLATLSSSQDQVPQPITSRLLGVFDGHARLGEQVSQYTVTELPKLIATKLRSLHGSKDRTEDEDPDDVVRILKESFIEIDKTAPAEISGGCTASVILQRKSKVYVANAGDSRSFLVVYRPSKQTVEVIYISREDKPHLLEERKRVERMGGQVWLPVVGSSRVLYTDPETGIQSGLAMSRSIGDWEVGELGVIAEPIVDVLDVDDIVQAQIEKDCQIPDDDEGMDAACFFSKDDVHVLAVSASDGLMDFTTPEMVAQTLAVSLYHKDGPHILTALEQLIYVAAHGWEQTKQYVVFDASLLGSIPLLLSLSCLHLIYYFLLYFLF
jgi:serine/threonine protein phosphatase PrpC